MLRIAIGSGSCRQEFKDLRFVEISKTILERLEGYKQADPIFLRSFPHEHTEYLEFDGKKTSMTVFNERTEEKRNLIVIQAFLSTFKGLNYISFGGVGRVFVEGLWVNEDGSLKDASEEDLYPFT